MVIGGAPSARVQHQASREFLEWGFQAFDGAPLFPLGAPIGEAAVQGGASRTVGLTAPIAVGYDLPVGQTGKVTLSIHYEGPLRAPIAKGEQVAELEIEVEGMRPSRVPLAAAEAVPVANWYQRLVNGVTGIF
jgi:D-alanyl-D-alanine carboxypeptidase (penicillin-binding protein 5/6)